MTHPASHAMNQGAVLAGRYWLQNSIAFGSMAEVWRGFDHLAQHHVAIKLPVVGGADALLLLERVNREAALCHRIHSPAVVALIDHGIAPDQRPFVVMELLDGISLADHLEQHPVLPIEQVRRMVQRVCEGLQAIHDAGVVHRDLSPDNLVMCTPPDPSSIKITDFGLARILRPAPGEEEITIPGTLIGTPRYMSPEQARGLPASIESDLYSVASVAFRCLTGAAVFDGATLPALLSQLAECDAPLVSQRRPDVPATVDAWFAKALSRDPAKRFGCAKQMADEWQSLIEYEHE